MKPQDFRVGSYIKSPLTGIPIKVTSMRQGFGFTYINTFLLKHIRPVPVTDAMLNDVGFKNNVANILFEGTAEFDGVTVYKIDTDRYAIKQVEFKYLHEMQNILQVLFGGGSNFTL